MWPMLLNLTHDECRRTLRRLELEAYSNMISVFRAQGALEDNRKKLLEELRAVLHISSDRHSAEARRVSNDEVLATIAHQLTGPNTGLGWISEGRRRVPLMPRGIPQTAYTEIADKTAEAIKEENKEILKKLEAEKLVAPKSSEEELHDPEGETAESALPSNDMTDEMLYPPVAMEDQTAKLWETELLNRKRKIPESGSIPDDCTLPTKNMRNIPVNTNQKHLNLSQIYSKYTQPATNKSSGQSKHSYNQVSKVSTSKSSQPHHPRSHKHRSHRQNKNAAQIVLSKQAKKAQEAPESPSKPYAPAGPLEYAGAPGSFQASYTQSILGGNAKPGYADDGKAGAPPHEPGAVPHSPASSTGPVARATPQAPKPRHERKAFAPDGPAPPKASDSGIKVLSNRQVVVAAGPARTTGAARLLPGKLLPATPTASAGPAPPPDKMIVVSKPQPEPKIPASKIIITSSAMRTPSKDPPTVSSVSPRPSDAFTPKGIPATDLKVSAKTFVLNQKPGQKMVVLPAKARTKAGSEVQLPLIHFKGIPTGMKLVPVSSQSLTHATKAPAVTVLAKPGRAPPAPATPVVQTANLADIVPAKNPPPRPTKGSVIVVQKGATIGKALPFAKNGGDVSKIIMGKNVTQLMQAAKPERAEPGKVPGNVIVLELNNDQPGRATTMSEILDNRAAPPARPAREPGSTDWEMELDTVSRKGKDDDDKLNSLHLDLGMSSDSDGDYMLDDKREPKLERDATPRTPAGERGEMFASGAMSIATRTLLSQLQDEGSSSNDSSFALKAKAEKRDPAERDALTEAKEKLSEKVADARSRRQRIDVFSTAISSADINLDAFAYLDENIMADDERAPPEPEPERLPLDKP